MMTPGAHVSHALKVRYDDAHLKVAQVFPAAACARLEVLQDARELVNSLRITSLRMRELEV
jgi:hypothetical protein